MFDSYSGFEYNYYILARKLVRVYSGYIIASLREKERLTKSIPLLSEFHLT